MKKLIALIIVSAALSGCAAVCNPNGIGVAAGAGMSSGSLGIPGLALAGAQIGACGAYKLISHITAANTTKPAEVDLSAYDEAFKRLEKEKAEREAAEVTREAPVADPIK